ncbi:serpin B3 isoform X2 [Anabrus simplex]
MGAFSSVSRKDALEAVAKSNIKFSFSVYKALCQQQGNIFFSPLSLEVILALVFTGAKGKTAEQMIAVLQLPTNRKVTLAGFQALLEAFKSTSKMTVYLANRAFIQAGSKIRSDFKATVEKHFQAGIQELDFEKKCAEAGKEINDWVNKQTSGKISTVVSDGMLSEATILVLVNAVYFKGKWNNPFNVQYTAKDKFHVSSKEIKEVPLMHQKENFRYGELNELKAKAVEMPYQGNTLSLLILLPDEIDGLQQLEAKLPSQDFTAILQGLRDEEVCLSLPKFKLEHSSELTQCLKQLGMTNAFDFKSADLTGIADCKQPLIVSSVVQKAFIEVDEMGSEAGAATVTSMNVGSSPGAHPKVFRADHPFFFALIERTTAAPLFMGRYCRP